MEIHKTFGKEIVGKRHSVIKKAAGKYDDYEARQENSSPKTLPS